MTKNKLTRFIPHKLKYLKKILPEKLNLIILRPIDPNFTKTIIN